MMRRWVVLTRRLILYNLGESMHFCLRRSDASPWFSLGAGSEGG